MLYEKELKRRLEFYEKKMNDEKIDKHWRNKAEYLYWHYLDLLTRPSS